MECPKCHSENKENSRRDVMKKTTMAIFLSGLFFSPIGFAGESEIIEAAKSGNAERVKVLLKADPSLVQTVDSEIGATALHWALIYGKKEVVKVILAYDPDVNKTEAHEGTPMHWAAHFDDAENIRWLLDKCKNRPILIPSICRLIRASGRSPTGNSSGEQQALLLCLRQR
jgi:hypothetical protein